jgi:hypothetical protein
MTFITEHKDGIITLLRLSLAAYVILVALELRRKQQGHALRHKQVIFVIGIILITTSTLMFFA